MAELVDAPIVDIRRIDHAGRVAGYVAKYVAQEPAKVGSNKRYWQSRDYDLDAEVERPELPPGVWYGRPWPGAIASIVSDLIGLGYSAEWDGEHRCRIVREAPGGADA